MPTHLRIKERRLGRGLTQEQLVDRMHLYLPTFSVSHLSKIERGLRVVKSDEIPAFARSLDCDIEDLHDPRPPKRH
jgi:transcriptional regulator with XRE-family HTH domain